MKNIVIIGTQWGDEGKGKVVDYLAENAHVVVRFQGGPNAGHTIVIGENKFALHHIPSGIFQDHVTCVIANGVVIDPVSCYQEIAQLKSQGFLGDPSKLVISPYAHVILPYHKAIDSGREEKRGKDFLGTTQRGIGPVYEDKVVRKGIRLGDLLDTDKFRNKLSPLLEEKNFYLKNFLKKETFDLSPILETYLELGAKLKTYIGSPYVVLQKAFQNQERVIFEGAQGTLLDLDHGTFPYVTSSNTLSAAACVSSGIGPQRIDAVVGVVKAYTTRVGTGQFPTELTDSTGEFLQKEGHEFGTTTGRKRRCGWLDLVILKHAVFTNGLTHLAITKLDVLNKLEEIKICTGYEYKGKVFKDLLENTEEILTYGKPVYETLPGWKKDMTQMNHFSELPSEALDYLKLIEDELEVPVAFVSTSPERTDVLLTESGLAFK
ncbi:MAG: adenylosuccinate synthase [Deltaproteobacteria bacterium]|nr:adenylosuccinate synthase [Deltaproteobacteria bacterium]